MKSKIRPHFSFALVAILATGIFTLRLNAAPEPPKPDPAVAQQLADAQAKAAQLQGTLLAQNSPRPGMSPAASAMPGMGAPTAAASPAAGMPAMSPAAGMGNDKMIGMLSKMMPMMEKMMPMMEKIMGGMGGGAAMPAPAPAAPMSAGAGGMGMEMGMDMMGMSSMTPNGSAAMPDSALPGFPGASHLYHVGSTGFYLDHPEHIALTTDQQVALNKIKEQALLAKSATDRSIEQAEQELGVLTAADQPEIAKVEAKVRDIAKMAADQRLAFIRAVGEAAKLVTPDQRKVLTGFAPPAPVAPAAAMPAASDTPMPMKDM